MEERLTRTALRNGYMMLWSRNDPELIGISNLVMSLPRHILAFDSLPYVRYLSEKLALAFPSSHSEILEVHSVWKDFIFGKGPRLRVKEKIRLIARLKRETDDTERRRCLRALSKFLRITEGEHSYMDAMLLYLSSVLWLEWRRKGDAALCDRERRRIADGVRDGLIRSKEECSAIRKRSFAPALITDQYNTELLERIRLREEADGLLRKAEADFRREDEKRLSSPSIRERKAKLSMETGRARLSTLAPETGKRLSLALSSLSDGEAEICLARLRAYIIERIYSTMPEIAGEAMKVIGNRRLFSQGKMTRTDLRRHNATFIHTVSGRGVTGELYAATALSLAVMDGRAALRGALDSWLVPWLRDGTVSPDEAGRVRAAAGTTVEDRRPI